MKKLEESVAALKLMLPILCALTAASFAAAGVSAPSMVAVLSSENQPYREALDGMEEELGASIPTFVLSEGEPKIPSSVHVILTFGPKAALQRYPAGMVLIFAVSPGIEIERPAAISVDMEPDPAILLANLKKIQPGLKKLGVFWRSSSLQEYMALLSRAAPPQHVAIESVRLADSAEVAYRLRAIYGKVNALWLPPDPLLLNSSSLSMFTEFSRLNHVPLFVPTPGLVGRGATAAVASSFREFGRLSGALARAALKGQSQGPHRYPTNVEIVINKTAAEQIGLQIPEDVLRQAKVIFP